MNNKIKITLFSIFLFFACTKEKKEDNAIYYLLGDEISELISFEIKSLGYSGYKPENFYILFVGFTEDKELNKIYLQYCEECDNEVFIKKTTRFFMLKNNKLPIIFSSDSFFTDYKNDEDNFTRKNRWQVSIEFDLDKRNAKRYISY